MEMVLLTTTAIVLGDPSVASALRPIPEGNTNSWGESKRGRYSCEDRCSKWNGELHGEFRMLLWNK